MLRNNQVAVLIEDQNTLNYVLPHSSRGNAGLDQVAATLADLYGIYRQKHLVMVGDGYQTDGFGKINALSDSPHFRLHVERNRHASDANITEEAKLQLDLIQAAGSMTVQIADAIREIAANVGNLSIEQKTDLIKVVFNTYQLQQASEGRIQLNHKLIETLSLETIQIMDTLSKDVVLPPSLKIHAANTIRETANKFQLQSVLETLTKFEKDSSAQNILNHSVDGLKTTLRALLEQDGLDDAIKSDIDKVLAKLEELDPDDLIPRDILTALKKLSNNLQQIELTADMKALAEKLEKDTYKLREANIHRKAEVFNLTLAQVRSIEATMDQLDTIKEALPENEIDLKAEIESTISALDKNPISVESIAKLEMISSRLADFVKNAPANLTASISESLNSKIEAFQESSQFTKKIIADGVSKLHNIPKQSIAVFVDAYKSIRNSLPSLKSSDKGLFVSASQTLKSLSQSPISIASFAGIKNFADKSTTITQKVAQSLKSAMDLQKEALKGAHGLSEKALNNSVNLFTSLNDYKNNLVINLSDNASDVKEHLINLADKALDSVNRAPSSVTTLVDVTRALKTAIAQSATKGIDSISNTIARAQESLKTSTSDVIDKTAKTTKEPLNKVGETIRTILASVTESAIPRNKPSEPKFKPQNYTDTGSERQTMSFADQVKTPSILDWAKGCVDCTSKFCEACGTTGIVKNLGSKVTKTLSNAFAAAASQIKPSTPKRSLGQKGQHIS